MSLFDKLISCPTCQSTKVSKKSVNIAYYVQHYDVCNHIYCSDESITFNFDDTKQNAICITMTCENLHDFQLIINFNNSQALINVKN
jgi:hypothetical protein